MEPFLVDFAMQRGHEMLITRDPPFKRSDMDEIDLNMLQAETIPRLLRVDWLEVDECIQFRYSLTGKRMLAQRLAAQPLRMMDYYELMLGVIEALDECRHYLLRECCCLLDERYLFVGERWSDVWLAYVPLREGCARQPYHEALLGLAARWGARVTEVEGGGLQMVLKLLEAQGSSLTSVRNAMLEWMGSHAGIALPDASAAIEPTVGTARPNAGSGQAGRRGFDAAIMTNPLARKSGDHDNAALSFRQDRDRVGSVFKEKPRAAEAGQAELTGYLDREWRTEEGKQADASRAKWLSGALTLVVCACCWRFVYLPSPGMEQLLICTGLTLLLLWGVVKLWSKLGRNRAPLPILSLEDTLPEQNSEGLLWGQSPSSADVDPGRQRAPGLGISGLDSDRDRRNDSSDSSHPIGSAYAQGNWEAATEIAAASDETTLLSDASSGGKAPGGGTVMREHQGQSLRIALPIGISVIGRSAEISHIVDTAEGVSRTHLELEWDGRQAKARDLASRNGSLLNGAPMVPYKLYELQRTDWIRLAGTDGPRYSLHDTD